METSVRDFVAAGCELATPLNIFIAVYEMSGRNPCKGCAYDSHGSSCKAKKALFSAPTQAKLNPVHTPTETVRETAARLGVSISEVRRMRRSAV